MTFSRVCFSSLSIALVAVTGIALLRTGLDLRAILIFAAVSFLAGLIYILSLKFSERWSQIVSVLILSAAIFGLWYAQMHEIWSVTLGVSVFLGLVFVKSVIILIKYFLIRS